MADSDPGAAVVDYGGRLADAVDAAIEPWVIAAITRVLGRPDPGAATAAAVARADLMPRLRDLLARDIDDQGTTPLSILRDAARYPIAVLAAAGVAPGERDPDATARFPDDVYDLVPAAFADFGPAVAEAGVVWGAAKAFAHRERHRA